MRIGRKRTWHNNLDCAPPVTGTSYGIWAVPAIGLAQDGFDVAVADRYLIGAGRPGCVVSLASTHGTVGFAGAAAYGISKAGISHMTRILAIG